MNTAIYIGNEFKDRYGSKIDLIRVSNGEYRIRFEDGKVYNYIFESEIETI